MKSVFNIAFVSVLLMLPSAMARSQEVSLDEKVRILEEKLDNLTTIDRNKDTRIHNLHGEKELLRKEIHRYKAQIEKDQAASVGINSSSVISDRGEFSASKDLEIRNLRRAQFDLEKKYHILREENQRLLMELRELKRGVNYAENALIEERAVEPDNLSADLEAMHMELETISGELNVKEKELEELSQENKRLESRLKKTLEERERTLEDTKEQEQAWLQKQQELKRSYSEKERSMSQEIEDLKEQLASLKKSSQLAIEQKEGLLAEKDKMHDAKLYDMENQIDKLRDEVKKLAKENRHFSGQLVKTEEKNAELNEQLTRAEDKMAELKRSIPDQMSAAREPLEKEIRSLQETLKKSREQWDNQSAQAQKRLKGKIAGLQAALEEKERDRLGLAEELAKNSEQIEILKKLVDSLEQDKAQLNTDLQEIKEQTKNRIVQLKEPLEHEIELLEKQLKNSEKDHAERVSDIEKSYQDKVEEQAEKIRILEIGLSQKQTEIGKLEDERADLVRQVSEQERAIAMLREDLNVSRNADHDREETLSREIENLRQNLEQQASRVADLEHQLVAKAQVISEKEAIIEDFLKNQIDLGAEVKELRAQLENKQAIVDADILAKHQGLETENDQLRNERQAIQEALEKQKTVLKETKKTLAFKTQEYERLRESFDAQMDSAKQPLLEQIQHLKKKVSALEEQLRVVWGSTDKILKDLEQHKASIEETQDITSAENSKDVSSDLSEIGF